MRNHLPSSFPAGTTFRIEGCDGETLYLRGPSSITIESAGKVFTASANVTSRWLPGMYAWVIRRTDAAGNVSQVSSGKIEIKPDITSINPGTDIRSNNRRVYDAICAVIEKRASTDQQSYRINNRELVRMPIGDLLRLKSQYARMVRQEAGQGALIYHRVVF